MAEAKTHYRALSEWVARDPDCLFLTQPFGEELLRWTRAATLDDARRLARGLRELGLEPGARVALLSRNCAEWLIADLAISLAGLVSVPIYPTAGRDTIIYVLEHSGAKALLIGKLDDPERVRQAFSSDTITIAMRYPSIECNHDWQALIDASAPIDWPSLPAADELMTILYTSGSTGRPKGVALSYGAYQYACEATTEVLELTPEDRALSYLPLAHITERTCVAGPSLFGGSQLFFSDTLETFHADLLRSESTLFVSVPRLWTQFQSGVHAKIPARRLAILLAIPILGRLVARRIRRQLGFEHVRKFGSGSAPISPLLLKWYEKLGVDISEGWGMSETGGLSCTNSPFRRERIGTIGMPFRGTEMKLSDEGEILIRSPGLFSEYYREPELTREAFDADGFFHTGDRGEWEAELEAFRITGRVKDLFKSAKGKYVSPVPIESKLAGNPLLEQVCVMGSGLRAPVAVAVLSVASRGQSREVIGASLGETLATVNAMLESHERLAHLFVVAEEWSIDNGLLTPTMKIKRDKLEQKYAEPIQGSFAEPVVWLS